MNSKSFLMFFLSNFILYHRLGTLIYLSSISTISTFRCKTDALWKFWVAANLTDSDKWLRSFHRFLRPSKTTISFFKTINRLANSFVAWWIVWVLWNMRQFYPFFRHRSLSPLFCYALLKFIIIFILYQFKSCCP